MRQFIRARDAQVSFELDSVEYNDVLDTINIAPDAPELTTTVFSTENDGGESELGVERLIIDTSGPLSKNSPSSEPFIPLAAYQNLPWESLADTGCGISGTVSARAHPGISSTAGGNRRSNGRFVTQGAFVLTWDTVS